MKRPFVLVAVVLLFIAIGAGFGWQGRPDAQAQGGGSQTVNLPIVMRMPTLTPTPTLVPLPNGNTRLVSVRSDGVQGNEHSFSYALSADGRFVTFVSNANNLVPGDTNNREDIFVRDMQTGDITRVNVASDGAQALQYWSAHPDISDDGRFVVFSSAAPNLVPNDTNDGEDIFVHDRLTHQTTRVSVASDGTQSQLNRSNTWPRISGNGRYVTYTSGANNLVPNDTNDTFDVFVHDRQTGETTRVSVNSQGQQLPWESGDSVISGDGRYIVFASLASITTNDTMHFSDVYLHDRVSHQTSLISVAMDGLSGNDDSGTDMVCHCAISADGRYVVFPSDATNLVPGDTNGFTDTFIRDVQSQQTSLVSVGLYGALGNGQSGHSYSPGNGNFETSVSQDGRYVAFSSLATNMIPNDNNNIIDSFVRDRVLNQNFLINVSINGLQESQPSSVADISPNGRYITFTSRASNIVPNDMNGSIDAFWRDWNVTIP